MPALMQIPGCMGLSLLVDRDLGRCIATSSWDSEDAMRASSEAAGSLRTMATGRFVGSVDRVEEWEIAIVHREHHASDGSSCRCTWLQCQMGGMQAAHRDLRCTPCYRGLRRWTGFCSASLFVDRTSGRAVSATAWDTHADMEANREASEPAPDPHHDPARKHGHGRPGIRTGYRAPARSRTRVAPASEDPRPRSTARQTPAISPGR